MGRATKAIVKGIVEFYDSNNVRIGMDGDEDILVVIKEKNSDSYVIDPETADKTIPIVNTNGELLMITTDNPIVIKLNGGTDELTVSKKFMMVGDIDSLIISNTSETLTCNVEVSVGNDI